MNKKILILFSLILFLGCQSKKNNFKPTKEITKPKTTDREEIIIPKEINEALTLTQELIKTFQNPSFQSKVKTDLQKIYPKEEINKLKKYLESENGKKIIKNQADAAHNLVNTILQAIENSKNK